MRAGWFLPLLVAAALAAEPEEVAAVRRTLERKSFHASVTIVREFAKPQVVLVRGRFRDPDLLEATVATANAPGDAPFPSRFSPLLLRADRFERKGEAVDPGWLKPGLGLAAHLPRLLEALAPHRGKLEGAPLAAALRPLGDSFAIHPVGPDAWCRFEIEIADGLVGGATLQLAPQGRWTYRIEARFHYEGEPPWEKEREPAVADVPEPGAAAVRRAVARGVRHLLAAQKPDGSWVSPQAEQVPYPAQRVAITAVCVRAVAPDQAAAARRGLRALEGLRAARVLETAKPAHGAFDFSVWGPAFGLLHLAELKPDPKLVRAYVDLAWAKQRACGGWTYKVGREDGSVTIVTASMVEGLWRWREQGAAIDAQRFARALADLRKNRDDEGSFGYFHDGGYESAQGPAWTTPESAGRSVQAQHVLVLTGEEEAASLDEPVRRFFRDLEHFEKQRGVYAHSPPYMIAGYYYHYALYFVARALKDSTLPEAERAKYRRVLLARLLAAQEKDGSWIDSPAGGKPYATAMAVLTLRELL